MVDPLDPRCVRIAPVWVVDRHKLCAPWLLANSYCLSPPLPE